MFVYNRLVLKAKTETFVSKYGCKTRSFERNELLFPAVGDVGCDRRVDVHRLWIVQTFQRCWFWWQCCLWLQLSDLFARSTSGACFTFPVTVGGFCVSTCLAAQCWRRMSAETWSKSDVASTADDEPVRDQVVSIFCWVQVIWRRKTAWSFIPLSGASRRNRGRGAEPPSAAERLGASKCGGAVCWAGAKADQKQPRKTNVFILALQFRHACSSLSLYIMYNCRLWAWVHRLWGGLNMEYRQQQKTGNIYQPKLL